MRNHKLFILLLVVIVLYLGVRSMDNHGWDDWGIGSAQVMMSLKHWNEDGLVYNKFLFLPTGYSKTVRYFDETEMRHHVRGTMTGDLIENKLYYTHYPPGFLMPYFVLYKLGFSERFLLRFLAIVFSLIGIGLMYSFFVLISKRAIALLATFYYTGSFMFLGLADSLANQPIDDFFRFLILLLSVLSINIKNWNYKRYKIYNIFIWLSYFLLALSSYDSTFFIFVWLVGLDIIVEKKFLWKKWLFFASAPIAAFGLQMVQNIWYLGYNDAVLDIFGTFGFRANFAPGSNFLIKHVRSMLAPLSKMTNLRVRLAFPTVGVIIAGLYWFRDYVFSYFENKNLPKIVFMLFIAGFAYPFILSSSAYFPYQGRQLAPAIGLLLALATYFIFQTLKKGLFKKEWNKKDFSVFVLLTISVVFLWSKQVPRTISYVKDWPNKQISDQDYNMATSLNNFKGNDDAVVFKMDITADKRYPRISSVFEYYADMPILSFKIIEDLVVDLENLKIRSEFPFRAIISPENNLQKLEIEGLLKNKDFEYEFFQN